MSCIKGGKAWVIVVYFVGHISATAHMWNSGKNLQNLVLSFYYMGLGDQDQSMRFTASTFLKPIRSFKK